MLGARLVMLAIADYSDDRGEAYPSVASLARKSGLSERATHYAIAELIEIGELVVEKNAGPRGCNIFRVQLLHGCKHSTPAKSAPVQNTTEKGCKDCTQTVIEPSLIKKEDASLEESREPKQPGGTAPERDPSKTDQKKTFPVGSTQNPKPTCEQIAARLQHLGMPASVSIYEAEQFAAHYNSNGWKVGGKTKMISWESACVTWKARWSEKQARKPISNVAREPVASAQGIRQRWQIENDIKAIDARILELGKQKEKVKDPQYGFERTTNKVCPEALEKIKELQDQRAKLKAEFDNAK